MSLFLPDAALLGLKEALKLALVWLVFRSYLKDRGADGLLHSFYAGLALTTLLFGVSFIWPPGVEGRLMLSKLVGYVFFIFFMASLILLYLERKGIAFGLAKESPAVRPLVIAGTVVYFCPDIVSSSLHVRELSLMSGNMAGTYFSGGVAFLVPLALLFYTLRNRGRTIGRYLGAGQLLLVLALIKLLGGGSGEFGELSLIPSVQRGAMKLVHDMMHQTFVYLLVPDHPLVRTEVWNFVGILFGSNFGLAAALAIMLSPPLWYLYEIYTASPPEYADAGTPARRRLLKAGARRTMILRAIPVVAFMLIVFASWYIDLGSRTAEMYLPRPKPVVADKGIIVVPLTDPTMDLMDGNLHKFSVTREDESFNILAIRKPDGKLAVCLDACEICPPEGYGLSEDHVVCVYCKTPIPVDTLGKPGGCNPIPLDAEISDKSIRIDVDELDRKWKRVKSGEGREGIR